MSYFRDRDDIYIEDFNSGAAVSWTPAQARHFAYRLLAIAAEIDIFHAEPRESF